MKPKSDEIFAYDPSVHRYKLTELGVLQRLNRNLGDVLADNGEASDPRNEPNILLDRVSRQIYGYVLSHTATPYRRERQMALDPAYRVPIMEAMEEQLIYILTNGDLSSFNGVNLDTGMTVDPSRMRQAEIAPMARDILARCGLLSVVIDFRQGITPDYEGEGY
jgi:hypothetical protein